MSADDGGFDAAVALLAGGDIYEWAKDQVSVDVAAAHRHLAAEFPQFYEDGVDA